MSTIVPPAESFEEPVPAPPVEDLPHDDSVSHWADDVIEAVSQRMEVQQLPTATYRVQFNSQCTFREVTSVVPYLFTLGISDLYASPFLKAKPGSMHGYDVVDHSEINPEIGTLEELRSLRSALREHGMGLIADVVPNHMSASSELNRWWQDVLENGQSSQFASYFDIDWQPLKPDLSQKVLLPVLGEQFGMVLEEGQLQIHYDAGSFWLKYYEHCFPISPRSYAMLLTWQLEELSQELGEEHTDLLELFSILTAIRNLPPRTETDADKLIERRREKEVIKRRLHDLTDRSARLAEFVAENVRHMNGQPGDPHSFDLLDELLQDQAYRLAYWRVASDEINYRRFFDINELAAICTELPQVFEDTHQLLFSLLDEGTITGLRIDHPDGLYDPQKYMFQLQERHFLRLCREVLRSMKNSDSQELDPETQQKLEAELLELWQTAASIPGSPMSRPLYVVVEKILAHGETLPEDWPVHGTVGYEFLNAVNGLFVDRAGERSLSTYFMRFTGHSLDFADLAYQCKRLIARMSMASELSVLGYRLDRISEQNRRTRDFTLNSLMRAMQEVVACFGVYRTYVHPDRVLERDVTYIQRAVARAKRLNPAMSESIFNLVRDVLLLKHPENVDEGIRVEESTFVGKFQQITGPIMAKSVEDTAFYRFNRLISLNEVGGEPAVFGTSPAEFHRLNQSRLPRLCFSLNGSSTHDTKRSEDVRARISVLSEIPSDWHKRVQRWSRLNRRHKAEVDGQIAPNANTEYLLYQTLIGIWDESALNDATQPTFIGRLQEHMLKVVREAKSHTSWISPHEPYESALHAFVQGLFHTSVRRTFLLELADFAGKVAVHGYWNSLSQLILKLASPGVPDFYQGTETWTLTLVDPDNRHPVDFHDRRQRLDTMLADLARHSPGSSRTSVVDDWLGQILGTESGAAKATQSDGSTTQPWLQELLDTRKDGRIKLFVTLLALHARRRLADLFTRGDYLPLETTGEFADHIVAFARHDGQRWALVVVPRLTVKIVGLGGPPPVGDIWKDTAVLLPAEIGGRTFSELFSRSTVTPESTDNGAVTLLAATVLQNFPVALLFA